MWTRKKVAWCVKVNMGSEESRDILDGLMGNVREDRKKALVVYYLHYVFYHFETMLRFPIREPPSVRSKN
jgi:hypothetical protein